MNQLILRKDTASNWNTYNPILEEGELGYDTTNQLLKIGDGETSWDALSPIAGHELEDKTISASNSGNIIVPSANYYGLSKVSITNISGNNIRSGVTILGVTGTILQDTGGSGAFTTEPNTYGTTVIFATATDNPYGETYNTIPES